MLLSEKLGASERLSRFVFALASPTRCLRNNWRLIASKSYLRNYKGTPYQDSRYHGGAQKIPGRVECSYYDRGGEGVAYHDVDAKNNCSGGLNPADGTT